MIPEWESNTILLSELLPKSHYQIFHKISTILKSHNIEYELIAGTKDIWCRDYMPFQVTLTKFVQFNFSPCYLRDYSHLRSKPQEILSELKISPKFTDIKLEGGNLVNSYDTACVTDRIFKENEYIEKHNLIEKICHYLNLSKVIIFPTQPYDVFGHIDSMIRFIDKDEILINDFRNESKSFNDRLEKILSSLKYNIKRLTVDFKHKYNWCYLNYIYVKDVIIIPAIGINPEINIVSQFGKIFPNHSIYMVKCKKLLSKGGGLRCISWNMKT